MVRENLVPAAVFCAMAGTSLSVPKANCCMKVDTLMIVFYGARKNLTSSAHKALGELGIFLRRPSHKTMPTAPKTKIPTITADKLPSEANSPRL